MVLRSREVAEFFISERPEKSSLKNQTITLIFPLYLYAFTLSLPLPRRQIVGGATLIFIIMAEEMTKVYCMPNGDNTQLLAELMNAKNQGTDAATMAALFSRNNDGWQNNPFMYLIWLAFMGGNFGGFGGNGCNSEINSRFNALSGQIADNHNNDIALQAIQGNACAINHLAESVGANYRDMALAVSDVRNSITQVGGAVGLSSERVINAIQAGNLNLVQQLKDCCCQNKEMVLRMGYEGQLRDQANTGAIIGRVDQLANGITQGFSATAYEAQRHTNEIVQAGNANTQRIIDTLQDHWKTELSQALQDEKFKNSQLHQNAYLAGLINGTNPGGSIW